jgi:Kelch motif
VLVRDSFASQSKIEHQDVDETLTDVRILSSRLEEETKSKVPQALLKRFEEEATFTPQRDSLMKRLNESASFAEEDVNKRRSMPIQVAVNLTGASLNSTLKSACNEQSLFQSKEEYVFVFGGFNANGFLNSVEVYDVKRGIWRNFKQVIKGRTQGSAVSLPGVKGAQIWLLGGRD